MKHFLSLIILSLIFVPAITMAASTDDVKGAIGLDQVQDNISLGDESPVEMTYALIKGAMLFLGLIAVIIILLAGFKWMTAGGNEDKISEAKKLMTSGVVGLLIILSAWGIASYVIGQVANVTTGADISTQ